MGKHLKILVGAVTVVIMVSVVFVVMKVFAVKPVSTQTWIKIPEGEYDPAVWGKSYPLEYKSYQKNLEMSVSPTGYGGSLKVQHSVKQPEILTNFKGTAFSKDYTEERGHPYALQDLQETKRISATSPGACMTCKSANLIDIYKDMGWKYASTPLSELFLRMKHSIACANCHDPSTGNLRAVNPAFIEAMGRRGVDLTKATREEMRSYVCGQCHVEYYFEPGSSKVRFPWDKGLAPEQMYAYYKEKPQEFEQDWIHPDSQAKMLKAQHPDFETWSSGTHGKAGVACADCHMPYVREEGKKYTSHWITSPVKHLKIACTPCHRQPEEWLIERIKTIQGNAWRLQHTAGMTVARAHNAIKNAGEKRGANVKALDEARELVRQAQWHWDIVAAENSMGFHNPTQVLATLGISIDLAHQAIEAAQRSDK